MNLGDSGRRQAKEREMKAHLSNTKGETDQQDMTLHAIDHSRGATKGTTAP
jgi:hypothetical protein